MAWTQANRDISIWTRYNELQQKRSPEEPDVICLVGLEAQEYVSKPFLYKCVVVCTMPGLKIAEGLIGTWATIRIRYRDPYFKSAESYWYLPRSGVIRSCKPLYSHDSSQPNDPQPVSDDTVRTYIVELVPWFSFLDLTTDFRIIQDVDVITLLDELMFDEIENPTKTWSAVDLYDITKINHEDYPKMEYCVQSRETTFNFLSRLMEEYGIFYYFDHGEAEQINVNPTVRQSKMVLCDKNEHFPALIQRIITCSPPSAGQGGSVTSWNHKWAPGSHEWTLACDNFANPREAIRGRYSSGFGMTGYSRYDFPDRAVDVEDEKKRAQRAEELEITGRELVEGGSEDCKTFFAGGKFGFFADETDNLALPEEHEPLGPPDPNQPIMTQGREYVLVTVKWTANEPYENNFWHAIAKLAEDDFSNAGTSGANQLAQQTFPPTFGTDYGIAINWGSWFGAGVFSKYISDVCDKLFNLVKDFVDPPKATFNVTFTALPLQSRYIKPLPDPSGEPFPLPYRPGRVTPKPRIVGPLLGVVVKDPSVESSAQDVCVDQFGRVHVRFWWDRSWPPWWAKEHKGPAKRMTAWLRVAENWADNQWGSYFPARVGQEVVVSFIDGDPDRPIVTGRVYSGAQPPPFLQPGMKAQPLPPGAMKPQSVKIQTELRYSGIKTQSTPRPNGDARRFHLLRFDDSWQKEQYLIRSQGRLDITAFNHRYETISRDRNLTVGGKKVTPPPKEIGGDYITKIYRHYYLHVGDPEFPTQSGNRITRLEQDDKLFVKQDYQLDSGSYSAVTGNYYLHVSSRPGGGKRDTIIDANDSLLIKGDLNQMISGNWSTALGSQMSVKSDTTIVLEAFTNISLVVGASSVVITPTSIAITAPTVLINSGGAPGTPIAPAAPPISDPEIPQPQEPTQADSGSSLDPPKWQD